MSERPTPVEIVRPNPVGQDVIASIISTFLRAWLAMLVLGALFPAAGISYWQAVLGILLIGFVNPSNYNYWSRARRSK